MAVTPSGIVVFGGTFDPIHNAHIEVAKALRLALEPCLVLVVPAGIPRLRVTVPVASPCQRLKMVEMAIAHEVRIQPSGEEVNRIGTTYTIDTMQDVRARYGHDHEYFLAVGSDALHKLREWHRINDLMRLCTFVVVDRPGSDVGGCSILPPTTIRVPGPMIDITASSIRDAYRTRDFDFAAARVPEAVHEYIIEKGIYR